MGWINVVASQRCVAEEVTRQPGLSRSVGRHDVEACPSNARDICHVSRDLSV